MKINLISLPFEETVKHPPICLGYIAALLKKDKNEIRIIDLNFGKKISNADLNIVATTAVDYYNCPLLNIEEIDSSLSKLSKLKTPLAIFGPHATTIPEYFIKFADYLIIGEPELTIKELVEKLNSKKTLKGIKGLYYKKGKNFIKNNLRENIKDLDKLPFPDRSLIKNNLYKNPLCKNHPYTMVLSSRGCPFRCAYCYMDMFGHNWRARNAKNVIEELIEIRKKYNIKEIWFRDDLFTLDKKRAIEICDGMIKNNLDLTWSCQTRVDMLDEELVKKMKESGCHIISLGIESGSQKILNNLKKNIKIEQIKKAVALCHKHNIRTRGYFIIGCPGETLETIRESFELAKQLDVDYFAVSILTPYPGTEIFENALKNKIIKEKSWDNALKYAGIIENEFSFKELLKIKRNLYLKYYLRPNYLIKRLISGKWDIFYRGFFPLLKTFFIKKFRGKKLD